jgi:hypothetical protein
MEAGHFAHKHFIINLHLLSHTFVMTAMIMIARARMMMMLITLISAIHISCKRNYYRTYQNSYQLQEQQRTGNVVRSGRVTPL